MDQRSQRFKRTALVVDDEAAICTSLVGILNDEGWEARSCLSLAEAFHCIKEKSYDLILLDVWMKDGDGVDALQKIKQDNPDAMIVIMSGHATIETAVKATKLGALDFLEKPLEIDKILPLLSIVDQKSRSLIDQTKPKKTVSSELVEREKYRIIGNSDFTSSILRQIQAVAPRNSWVLITGENGTGKELVARHMHWQSLRANKPFVAVNCAAIPETLIESELFGHAKGAFTNALNQKLGKFEIANQGTIFLDEIGDMSLKTQAKILRLLQEQSFERLGDTKTISIDVRVIAATNKNLQLEISKGQFREDLYYRLNVIPIHMSPLREHKTDVSVLVDYFLNRMAKELQEPKKLVSVEAMKLMSTYPWPGNIRELKNLIERLCIMVPGPRIEASSLPDYLHQKVVRIHHTTSSDLLPLIQAKTLKEAKMHFEKDFIVEKLEEFDWNITKTAEAIGVERSHLHRKLKVFKIDLAPIKNS